MKADWKASRWMPTQPLSQSVVTRSGHQMELKLYEHHFYKADWEELDISTGSIQRRLVEAA